MESLEEKIFNYIRDNLDISLERSYDSDYGSYNTGLHLTVFLTNPKTGQQERIISEYVTLD
jgi:hypothetical protein